MVLTFVVDMDELTTSGKTTKIVVEILHFANFMKIFF